MFYAIIIFIYSLSLLSNFKQNDNGRQAERV